MIPGISPASILGMALPWWAKYAAVAALLLAIWAHGATWAGNRAQAKAEALRAKQEAAALIHMQELAKRADEITLVYLTQTRTIRERGQTIIREVPKYVTAKDDAACVVPAGAIRLLNAAARNELPKPSASPDAALTEPPANP